MKRCRAAGPPGPVPTSLPVDLIPDGDIAIRDEPIARPPSSPEVAVLVQCGGKESLQCLPVRVRAGNPIDEVQVVEPLATNRYSPGRAGFLGPQCLVNPSRRGWRLAIHSSSEERLRCRAYQYSFLKPFMYWLKVAPYRHVGPWMLSMSRKEILEN